MWNTGYIVVNEINFYYEAKVYEKGSYYGIDFGRISKLQVRLCGPAGDIVMDYDRGWNITGYEENENAKAVLQILLEKFKCE